jgi:hypothetical protein
LGKGKEEGRPGWLARSQDWGPATEEWRSRESSGQGSGQGRDMSEVKCFVCKKFRHYAGQCPNRKKKKGGTMATTEETDFQTLFQKECAFHVLLQFS